MTMENWSDRELSTAKRLTNPELSTTKSLTNPELPATKEMRKLLAIILTAVLGIAATGAQEKFTEADFDSYVHDFGKINEAEGPVSHTFTFTNTGKVPFVITSVSISCGCTTPEYSKAPVRPGATGKFKVTFDPENRPGVFDKSIYLICNTEEKSIKLSLKGEVKARPRTLAEDYPFEIPGGLRISAIGTAIGTIPRGKVTRYNIGIANAGSAEMKLGVKSENLPAFVKITPFKGVLAPSERSEIEVVFDGAKTDKWGEETVAFRPVINGKVQENPISISAIFVEDVSKLTAEEIRNSARADFSSYFYHFSEQKRGATLTRTFDFKNSGKSDLIIRHLDTSSARITATTSKTTIRPGEEAVLTVRIDTSGAPLGRLSDNVLVITNDPAKPAREIRVMATITE